MFFVIYPLTQTPPSLPRWKRAFALRVSDKRSAKASKPPRQARWGLCHPQTCAVSMETAAVEKPTTAVGFLSDTNEAIRT